MDQTDIWMIGVIFSGVVFYICTVYFGKNG
jgi:hypothetical protein